MIDTTHPTMPPKIRIDRSDGPALPHQPDEAHLHRVFEMARTASPAAAAHRNVPRFNILASNFILEEYRIEHALGAGSFGVTYKAWDTLLETWVAIKEYFPVEWSYRDADGVTVQSNIQGGGVGGNDEQLLDYLWGLERFLDEARVLARVQHPYVVRVKRYFRAHGTAYIVMDYEEGEPLNAVLQDGETLDEGKVRGLLEDVLPALQAVHEQGVLHRDIKPANLYVRAQDHRVILIDFGAAREAVGWHSKSVTSLVTPGYSPPEQYTTRNDRYGSWTDVYALGAVLYRCVTGHPPVEATERLLEDSLEPAVRAGVGRYSAGLLRVIDRALALRPERRFATVAEMRAALNAPHAPDEDGCDGADILGFLPKVTWPVQPYPTGLSPNLSVEEIVGEDGLEISHPPTASRRRTRRGQNSMWLSPIADSSDRRRALNMLIGDRLAVAVVVGVLATGGIWVWSSGPVHEQVSVVPYALDQEKDPVGPTSIDPAISDEPVLLVSKAIPIQDSANPAAPDASSEVSPVLVEQPAPAQTAEGSVEQDLPPEAEDLTAPPIPMGVPITGSGPESAAGATPVLSPPDRDFIFKAQTGSPRGQAATDLTGDDAGLQQRGKLSPKPRNSVRKVSRAQPRPRPFATRIRAAFNFRWRRGTVRNPWEPPARMGFNQK